MFQTFENKRLTKVNGMTKIMFSVLILAITSLQALADHPVATENHGEVHEAEADHHGDNSHDEKFNAGEMIMHHIADAHQIHWMTFNEGEEGEWHLAANLPIILWGDNGLEIFGSGKFYHGEEIHLEKGHGYAYEDKYIMVDEVIYNAEGGLKYDEAGAIMNSAPIDFSITKTVVGLLLTTLIVLLILISVGKAYKKRGHKVAPSGLQSLMEPLIVFVEEQIIVPSIGSRAKAAKFTPFLLTVFFFIWVANLLGLMSFLGGYNVMGSISVTLVLALAVMIITNVNGNKNYWKHILWPDGVPAVIKILILVPIEVIQIVLKPAVLMIRLTANITAGHIIILAFTALIFIFGETSAVAGWGVGIGSVVFMVFMFFIELLVAFLQAYVFTLLASLYFGSAVEEAHH